MKNTTQDKKPIYACSDDLDNEDDMYYDSIDSDSDSESDELSFKTSFSMRKIRAENHQNKQ